jgi:hypothetical protein
VARKSGRLKKPANLTGCPICGAKIVLVSGLPVCESGHRITPMQEDWNGKIFGHVQPKSTEPRPVTINPQRKRNPLKFEE